MSPPVPRSRSALTLFSHLDCPRSHAVRLVLAIKGLPHDLVYVDPKDPPSDLVAAVPSLSLPTLMERDVVLYEARIVAEYLDERFPHPPLLPNDPLGRARARLTAFRVEHDWFSLLGTARRRDTPEVEEARNQLRAEMLEAEPMFRLAKYFLSAEIALADCLILPLLWRLPSVGIRVQSIGPNIEAYAKRLFQTPLFQRTLSDPERALAA